MYFEHLRIPVGAGSLHAERLGRGGPPVLLLHGFGTCTFLWRHLSPVLAQAGFTCIALDLLGQGESDRPDESAVSLTAQAEYLARAIAALRLTDVTIVGQDVGAITALLLAAAPKGRVESVVLLSPPDPDDLPGPDIRAVQRASARVALSTNTLFAAKALLEPLLQGAVANPLSMPERLVARYLAPYVGSEGVTQLLHAAAAVELSADARTSLAALDRPVLVVNGLADGPRPSLSWPTVLPSAPVTIERLPDVGRLIPEEAPEAPRRCYCGGFAGNVPTSACVTSATARSLGQRPFSRRMRQALGSRRAKGYITCVGRIRRATFVQTHYPEEMAKPKLRPRREVTVNSPYQEARDEMFQQIMQCGVIGCHPEDQKEWFDNTLQYLAGRYPELKPSEVTELRTLGERFAQPPKAKTQEAAAV